MPHPEQWRIGTLFDWIQEECILTANEIESILLKANQEKLDGVCKQAGDTVQELQDESGD